MTGMKGVYEGQLSKPKYAAEPTKPIAAALSLQGLDHRPPNQSRSQRLPRPQTIPSAKTEPLYIAIVSDTHECPRCLCMKRCHVDTGKSHATYLNRHGGPWAVVGALESSYGYLTRYRS